MTRRPRREPAIVAFGLFFGVMALTAIPKAQGSLPSVTKPVNDFAGVIDGVTVQTLDARIESLFQATHDAVVVVTVHSIAPYASIEEYAAKLYEHAGIGQKGQDNGILVVVAVADHKVRIEVGYGLEPYVTDGFAGDTIRTLMLPAFRRGDYGGGILAGTTQVIAHVAAARGVTLADVPAAAPAPSGDDDSELAALIPIGILVLFVVLAAAARRRGPPGFRGPGMLGPWSGWGGGLGGFGGGGFGGGGFRGGGFGGFGGGGGGFGGFGGGMSGGGGASGGW